MFGPFQSRFASKLQRDFYVNPQPDIFRHLQSNRETQHLRLHGNRPIQWKLRRLRLWFAKLLRLYGLTYHNHGPDSLAAVACASFVVCREKVKKAGHEAWSDYPSTSRAHYENENLQGKQVHCSQYLAPLLAGVLPWVDYRSCPGILLALVHPKND